MSYDFKIEPNPWFKDIQEIVNSSSVNLSIQLLNKILKNGFDIHYQNEELLKNACKSGNLELVKYLLESSELVEHSKILDLHLKEDSHFSSIIDNVLYQACESVNLELVEYLLIQHGDKFNLHLYNEYALRTALSTGNIDLVNFLLFSPKLKEHAIFTEDFDIDIKTVFEKGQLDLFKYLLLNPNIIEQVEILKSEGAEKLLLRQLLRGANQSKPIYQWLVQYIQVKKDKNILDNFLQEQGLLIRENKTALL